MFRALNPLRKDRKHRATLSETKFQPCNIPPLLIVNAVADYHARSKDELSFLKGDLFHVINNSNPSFYQVCNPLTNQVGMAPVQLFRTFDKKSRAMSASLVGGSSEVLRPTQSYLASSTGNLLESHPSRQVKSTPLSARIPLSKLTSISFRANGLFTFESEREDELSFEQGDQLVVVAQSTPDWFIARKVQENNFGLVPFTYIEFLDPKTGEPAMGLEEKLPSVRQWKQSQQDTLYEEHHENSNPSHHQPTDSYHSTGIPSLDSHPHSPSSCTSSYLATPTTPLDHTGLDLDRTLTLDTAHVISFIRDSTGFIFIIQLRFESVGLQRHLYRDYTDFYNFHLNLLNSFPHDAGRTGERRILPFMPGPLVEVDEEVTAQRRADLDLYIQQLFLLPHHIQHTDLFRTFFRLRVDDFETSLRNSHVSFPESDTEPEPTTTTTPPNTTSIHVKVHFQSEIFAFKLPPHATNFDLHERICLRLGDRFSDLTYLDSAGHPNPLELTVPLHKIVPTKSKKLIVYAH